MNSAKQWTQQKDAESESSNEKQLKNLLFAHRTSAQPVSFNYSHLQYLHNTLRTSKKEEREKNVFKKRIKRESHERKPE